MSWSFGHVLPSQRSQILTRSWMKTKMSCQQLCHQAIPWLQANRCNCHGVGGGKGPSAQGRSCDLILKKRQPICKPVHKPWPFVEKTERVCFRFLYRIFHVWVCLNHMTLIQAFTPDLVAFHCVPLFQKMFGTFLASASPNWPQLRFQHTFRLLKRWSCDELDRNLKVSAATNRIWGPQPQVILLQVTASVWRCLMLA